MSEIFTTPIRVRWAEVDPQGVVFNPNYLLYADVAATEYYRHLGVLAGDYEDILQIYVVDAHVRFISSARYDDLLDCTVETGRIGNSSFDLDFNIYRQGQHLTAIRMTVVRAVDGKSVPLSDAFRALISGARAPAA